MMKYIFITLLVCSTQWILGQVELNIPPTDFGKMSVGEVKTLSYILEKESVKPSKDSLVDIGIGEEVSIDLINAGTKVVDENGDIHYRLKISVENAVAVGVEFSNFSIPENSKLYVYNSGQTISYGAFTSKNNKKSGRFAIRPMPFSTIILDYIKEKDCEGEVLLVINRIAKMYRLMEQQEREYKQAGINTSTSCLIDVHCEPNLEVERSVMKWSYRDVNDNTYYVCSCSMINQDVLANDIKPYVLTARHCGKDADLPVASFYFNYQSNYCGSNTASQNVYSMVGATKRASRLNFDMFLMELDNFPEPDFNVYLPGWARYSNSTLTNNMMGISHPSGGVKVISLGTKQSNTNPNFWRVQWGVNFSPTLPGSSGSPLFERNNNLTIGWLSYGVADCSDPSGIERYGKLKDAWDGPQNDKKLKTWLDPNDNGKLYLLGRDPCFNDVLVHNRTLLSAQAVYQPENKVTIQAATKVETLGTAWVKNNAFYKFSAGSQVVLKPGFHADYGCNFIAKIEGCDQVAFKQSLNQVNNEGFDDPDKDSKVSLFPNPSKDFINVKFVLKRSNPVSIVLYNLNGSVVKVLIDGLSKMGQEGVNTQKMYLSKIQSGAYILVVTTNEYTFKKQIIKLE